MKVKAKVMCFIGGARRRPGDVFEVPAGFVSKHIEPVEVAEKPKARQPAKEAAKEVAKEPNTFSAISKTLPTPKGADLI